MEIHLDNRAVKQIRVAAAEAIEDGDNEALREEILDAFPEEAVEEIETRLGSGDFNDLLSDLLEEWSGDDVDELFELIETQLAESGVDLKYTPKEADDEDEEDEEDDDDYDEDEDSEEYDEYEEYEEPGADDEP